MKEYELKKRLNELLDYTYPNDPLLKRYKYFRIEFYPEKALKSKHGEYDYRIKPPVIRIFNMYRDWTSLAKTVIHELAHHINLCRNKKYGHGKEFYSVYEELLFAAFDTHMLSREDILAGSGSDSCDRQKVLSMISRYRPKGDKSDSSDSEKTVCVLARPGFHRKDLVRERGYRYHAAAKEWVKEMPESETADEQRWLTANEIPSELRASSYFDLSKGMYIWAVGKTYQYKDQLKKYGFRFQRSGPDGNGVWVKEMTNSREIDTYKWVMPELQYQTASMQKNW